MAKLIYGPRIGAQARLKPACSALILDAAGQKVLLTRRADNGRWCLPGGQLEPGESAAEGCVREVLEETGLHARVTRLVGIYSSPDMVLEYADGNRWQLVAFSFAAEVVSGEPGLSPETTAWGYFGRDELGSLDLMDHHYQRIDDYFAGRPEAFVR
jgi:8-oxo-dGTP pyrophosphatase MutT (NUDIX family)